MLIKMIPVVTDKSSGMEGSDLQALVLGSVADASRWVAAGMFQPKRRARTPRSCIQIRRLP